jgi:hypothetical protein
MRLTEDAAIAALSQTDAVIAGHSEEADFVRQHLPQTTVILAPMTAEVVGQAQPGDAATMLFADRHAAPDLAQRARAAELCSADIASSQFSAWLREDQGAVGRSSDHALM